MAERRLRNLTLTIEEDVARWARVEAAKKDMSVSRLVGDLLREKMLQKESYQQAMKRALARKPFLRSEGPYLTREEIYDRARFR